MNEGSFSTFEVRRHAMDALNRGVGVGEVANAYGVDRTTVYRWQRRYEKDGTDGLLRKPGSGRPRKLEDLDEGDLLAI
ncbi:MAG: helix-turn-helix domain-containing protein, partial [Planctomycetes bacterium]|nr:helix-turn-helix domain-containing protein [Planctomycetota bacterium]